MSPFSQKGSDRREEGLKICIIEGSHIGGGVAPLNIQWLGSSMSMENFPRGGALLREAY